MKIRAGLISGLVFLMALALTGPISAQSAGSGPEICGQYDTADIESGRYFVQNNRWGDNTQQCIQVTQSGFYATEMNHQMATNGPPGAYPSVVFGCHYGRCSQGSNLPMPVQDPDFNKLRTRTQFALPVGGVWDASYDLWFDPTARTQGQVTGAEIMVWPAYRGSIRPIGAKVDTVEMMGATWDVWYGKAGPGPHWQVTSYVRQGNTDTVDFSVSEVYQDAVDRGYAEPDWYLTSIQSGFEPWVGEPGMGVKSFEVTASGSGGGNGPSPSPTDRPTPSTAPSPSASPSVTATPGPSVPPRGGGHLCWSAVSVPQQWDGGYLVSVTVINGSLTKKTGWTTAVRLPKGQSLALAWNGKAQGPDSTGKTTVDNEFYNGTLESATGTTWGMVVLRPRGSTEVLTSARCVLR